MSTRTSTSIVDIRASSGASSSQVRPARFRLTCVTEGPFADGARECEAEVFTEVYNNTGEELAEEYAPYDAQCFLVVIDERKAEQDPVGAVLATSRIILPGPAGHKSIDDMTHEPWSARVHPLLGRVGIDLDSTMDIATLAVRPRGGRDGALAAAALCHGMSLVSVAQDVDWLVAILNERVLRMFSTWKVPLLEIPGLGPRPYYGSPASTPVYLNWNVTRGALRRHEPRAHRRFILGDMHDLTVDPLRIFASSTAERPMALTA